MNAATKDVLHHLPYIIMVSGTLGGCLSAFAFFAFGLLGLWEFGFCLDALYLALICAGVMFAVIFLTFLFLLIFMRYIWKF